MELKGRIKLITDTITFESGFSKREFVVTTPGQFPQDVKFEIHKEKAELLNGKKPGDGVVVHFDIRGNEHNGKYYNNLVAWKLDFEAAEAPAPVAPVVLSNGDEEEGDDLPF